MGIGGVSQRENPVHHRSYDATVEHGYYLPHVFFVAHEDAVDLLLLAEQQAQVQLAAQSGGCAAGAVPATGSEGVKCLGKEVRSDVVHHGIDPSAPG